MKLEKSFSLLLVPALISGQAFATSSSETMNSDPLEWESAVPIEELIEEDSGSVKFYLENPEQTVEASEKIPQGYLPKSEEQRMEVLYKGSREFQGFQRKPAHAEEMKSSTNRLKAIEKKLTNRKPAKQDPNKGTPTFWGNVSNTITGGAAGAYDTAKDSFGALYNGIFTAPPDLVFGESVHKVAIIQSKAGYIPTKIPLAKGVKTRLYVSGANEGKHAFVSDKFNIQRSIKGNHGVTVIEFTPEVVGLHKFYDPINKVEGWFLVR